MRHRHQVVARCLTLAIAVSACTGKVSGGHSGRQAVDDRYETVQEQAITVAAPGVCKNDDGFDAHSMAVLAQTQPTSGVLAMELDGGFIYTPSAGFVGDDVFTYAFGPSQDELTAPATVTIHVGARPGSPTATDDAYGTNEDEALSISAPGVLGNDISNNGAALTAGIVAQPAHGTASLAGDGSFLYTPAHDFNGSDTFTYRASAGGLASVAATVTISVTPVNDAPIAVADALSIDEDTPLILAAPGVLANDTDVDGDTLTAVLVQGPPHGTLTLGANGSVSYTPDANYNGADAFTYRANDGVLTSGIVTAGITVNAVNDAPVAQDDGVSTIRNKKVSFLLLATDIENDVLTFQIDTPPQHGTATLNATSGGVVYNPTTGYTGSDSFTFRANDGVALSAPATISITIDPPPPPEVDTVLPTSGPVGRPVQISGRYFEDTPDGLSLGGAAVTIDSWHDTYVVFDVPGGLAAGDHNLVLTTAQGDAPAVTFRVIPWIDDASPRAAAAGHPITISGSNFGAATGQVTVGGVSATIDTWTNTSVTFDFPAGLTGGPHGVVLTTQTAVASNPFAMTAYGSDQWIGFVTPDRRKNHSAVWTGSEFLIWGGSGENAQPLSNGYRYEPVSGRWSAMSTVGAPTAMGSDAHSAVWAGSRLFVWNNGNGGRYDPLTDTWASVTSSGAPTPRFVASIAWTGSRVIVWGGTSGGVDRSDGALYDPQNNVWSPMASTTALGPGHTTVWTGKEMIVWGGGSQSGGRYDPSTDTWHPTSLINAPSARTRHTAVWTGDAMIIHGGFITDSNTGAAYSPTTNEWTPIHNSTSGRMDDVAVWTGDAMVVFGGCTGTSASCGYSSNGEVYSPATDSWTLISAPNRTPEGPGMAAAWSGKQMIVWGGAAGFGADVPFNTQTSNNGHLYDPLAHSWSEVVLPTAAANEPSSRTGYSATWVGNALAIWGGAGHSDGAFFDPTSETWTAMAAGGPTARSSHIGVWTGTKLLIWGGSDAGGVTNTGALYDPSGPSWTATSATNPPPAGTSATAVWSGSKVIVWVGSSGAGRQYDPVANSWLTMSTTGAPTVTDGSPAVWTGTQMIVWDGTTRIGGRYDPAGDSWAAVSTPAVLTAHAGELVVWSGTEMLVWGGAGNASGAAYNPATDTWRTLTGAGGPGLTTGTGAWLGSNLLVFGARNDFFGNPLSLGGVYNGTAWSGISTLGEPLQPGTSATWSGTEMLLWGLSHPGVTRYRP